MSVSYTDAVVSAVRAALMSSLTYPGGHQPIFTSEAVGGGHHVLRTDLPDGRTMIVSNGDAGSTWSAPEDPPQVHLALYAPTEWESEGEPLATWYTENGLDPSIMDWTVFRVLEL